MKRAAAAVRFPGTLPGDRRCNRARLSPARRVTGGSAEERSDEGEAPARKGGAARSADYLDRRGTMGKQAGRDFRFTGATALASSQCFRPLIRSIPSIAGRVRSFGWWLKSTYQRGWLAVAGTSLGFVCPGKRSERQCSHQWLSGSPRMLYDGFAVGEREETMRFPPRLVGRLPVA